LFAYTPNLDQTRGTFLCPVYDRLMSYLRPTSYILRPTYVLFKTDLCHI